MRSQNMRSKRSHQNSQFNNDEHFYISESVGVGITAVVIFLAISLYSHCHHDTSIFFYDSEHYFIRNWGGMVGAHFAAMLYHLLGAGAYFFVGSLAMTAYMCLLGYRQERSWWSLLWLPVCVLSAALVVSLYDVDFVRGLPGGVIGDMLNTHLTQIFGFYGAAMIGWSTLWISHVMALRISFVRSTIRVVRNAATARFTFFF